MGWGRINVGCVNLDGQSPRRFIFKNGLILLSLIGRAVAISGAPSVKRGSIRHGIVTILTLT